MFALKVKMVIVTIFTFLAEWILRSAYKPL